MIFRLLGLGSREFSRICLVKKHGRTFSSLIVQQHAGLLYSSCPFKSFNRGSKKKSAAPPPFPEKPKKAKKKLPENGKEGLNDKEVSSVFKPVPVRSNPDDINLGEEIAGKISKQALLRTLNTFYQSNEIRTLSKDQGLDDYLYHQAYISFRKYCMDISHLPSELYVLFSDILQGAMHEDDIFPYFLTHARKVFPHLECLEDLKQISDLTDPPNWYPEARSINRKVIFHAGPTNSGKTYHALERFLAAKSGVYCGPLKLLATEVFNKSNTRGTQCDLVTGEERRFASDDGEPASHVSCTVEMTNVNQTYEVAVIDEIQMMKDFQRGWAWTRALLGVPAEEIHVCGESAAIDLVKEIMISTGEEVEVRSYKRLTKLVPEDNAVGSLNNIQPGDCVVCFNKQDIYSVSRGLERLGVECSVIYGSLPPGTKLAMAQKFNDPNDPCKVLVATDAIGMGLNLNIRRIVFYSMTKLQLLDNGEKEMDVISVSQALQIAGRAGRFNTQWETGYVTCFQQEEMPIMKDLLSKMPDEILNAGLHPTFDQIELYAYHLPHATLANLVDIFISLILSFSPT
jgi:ATP-dependent RNA helicase SUPV3L1/SUV3